MESPSDIKIDAKYAEKNKSPTPVSPNYSAWSSVINRYASLEGFQQHSKLKDGVSLISIGGIEVEILAQDVEKAVPNGNYLIGFNGAVTNRVESNSKPPYFSGKSIASDLQLPFVAISDPSLLLDQALPLGWYAGNHQIPDLLMSLAKILESISNKLNCTPILFGGSGGGFASLAMSHLMGGESVAMVWNPQTSIGDYAPAHVLHYLRVAYPDLSDEAYAAAELPKADQSKAIRSILSKTNLLHSVRDLPQSQLAKVLFLQNRSDWHLQAHAKPYLPAKGWKRLSKNSFSNGENLAVHIGNWGPGHDAPPKEIILRTLKRLADNTSVSEASRNLSNELGSSELEDKYIHWFNADVSDEWTPSARCHQDLENLNIMIETKGAPTNSDLEYAIYLFCGEDRISTIWYQEKSLVSIPLNGQKVDRVRVFVRDIWGNVRQSDATAPNHVLT